MTLNKKVTESTDDSVAKTQLPRALFPFRVLQHVINPPEDLAETTQEN
ncbi:MAG: hypothetical protein RTU09_08220 [Candidatus Thorarchaeota archaeon]